MCRVRMGLEEKGWTKPKKETRLRVRRETEKRNLRWFCPFIHLTQHTQCRRNHAFCLNRLSDLDGIWQVRLGYPVTHCVR